MHDPDSDGAGKHRGRNPGILGHVIDEYPEESLNEVLERFVLGKQSYDDRVELQGACRAAPLHGDVDDPAEENVAGFDPVVVCFRRLQRFLESAQFTLGERDDDLLFGSKLMVDSGFRHPDRIGDHL